MKEGGQGGGLAVQVFAWRPVVVLRAVCKGLVGHLMVVPHHVPRILLRGGLEVRVKALGQPPLVVFMALHAFSFRVLETLVIQGDRLRVVVFVNLVSEGHHSVQVVALCNAGQRIEIPALVIHTAHRCSAPAATCGQGSWSGQRLCATCHTGVLYGAVHRPDLDPETVVIPGVGFQAAHIGFDAPIPALLGLHGQRRDDVGKSGVRRHVHCAKGGKGQLRIGEAQPRPQHGGFVGRIPGGHSVVERILGIGRIGLKESGNGLPCAHRREPQQEDQWKAGTQANLIQHAPNLPLSHGRKRRGG